MLKLLLDVAEWGLEHSHRQAADNALNAAARVLDKRERMYHVGRSKVDPAQLAQVILYRMLYMRPELLAWALEQVPRWQVTDYRVLVRFIDDCIYERPELIEVIRDARIVHQAPATTFRDLKDHLDFLETALTPEAREYGMYLRWYDHRYGTPDPEPELLDELLARLAAMLDGPALRKHAAWVLSRLVTRIRYQELPAVHQFMRERGETLPVVVWWNYRKFAPDVDVPKSMRFALPYAAPAKIESALADQIKQFATRHKREHEFVAEEQRREIADRESAKALKLGEQEAAAAKAAANGWKPDARTLAHYNKVLPQLRRDGSAGTLDLSSPYIYGMTNRMTFHNIEFEQTRDPRYKEYIERQEAAYEMILEHARMKYARQEAEAYARKSWLGRLLHKPRQ
jgi:hypothetical protein